MPPSLTQDGILSPFVFLQHKQTMRLSPASVGPGNALAPVGRGGNICSNVTWRLVPSDLRLLHLLGALEAAAGGQQGPDGKQWDFSLSGCWVDVRDSAEAVLAGDAGPRPGEPDWDLNSSLLTTHMCYLFRQIQQKELLQRRQGEMASQVCRHFLPLQEISGPAERRMGRSPLPVPMSAAVSRTRPQAPPCPQAPQSFLQACAHSRCSLNTCQENKSSGSFQRSPSFHFKGIVLDYRTELHPGKHRTGPTTEVEMAPENPGP